MVYIEDKYQLFKDRDESSNYVYMKLNKKDLAKVNFSIGSIYKYQDGLVEEKEIKPIIENGDLLRNYIVKLWVLSNIWK